MRELTSPEWLRQKGESTKTYSLFQIWLNLPQVLDGKDKTYQHIVDFIGNEQLLKSWDIKRTLQGQLLEYKSNIKKTPAEKTIRNLASEWRWGDRIIAYDNYLVQKRLEAREKEFEELDKHNQSIGRLIADEIEGALKEMKYHDYAPTTRMNILDSASASMNRVVKDERVRYNKPIDIRASDLKVQGEITEDINLVKSLSLKDKNPELIDEILSSQESLD